ncbi:Hypoxanthine-guanine phosphoribosyltransferase [hydrothermal vent metagenome]|uniref:Hypoxanthine-guanine phosphoribosyltransferase n=1 Tax=hydrothermal vent metagenome TaxID=652676 RepID=A0A3B0YG82_9ZZZZ
MFQIPDSIQWVRDQAECLFDEAQVEKALDNMAANISHQLKDLCPVIMCVMNGGLIVSGKLLTRLDFLLHVDYLHATRYQDEITGTDILWKAEPVTDLKGRVVLIVDDILDEGLTLETIVEYCECRGAKKVMSAVLVDKKHNRKQSSIQADFVGLEAGDHYLFGYGMDYKGYLRNASGIYAVKGEHA